MQLIRIPAHHDGADASAENYASTAQHGGGQWSADVTVKKHGTKKPISPHSAAKPAMIPAF